MPTQHDLISKFADNVADLMREVVENGFDFPIHLDVFDGDGRSLITSVDGPPATHLELGADAQAAPAKFPTLPILVRVSCLDDAIYIKLAEKKTPDNERRADGKPVLTVIRGGIDENLES